MNEFPAMEWQLVLGVRGERDVAELVAPMKGLVEHVFATAPDDSAAIPPERVAAAAEVSLGTEATVLPDVLDALARAKEAAGEEGGVVVAGSLYLVGEVRAEFDPMGDRSPDVHLRIEAERAFNQDDDDHDDDDQTD
jgi:dihydrofolate synthase/folylpolyglutamate synthase